MQICCSTYKIFGACNFIDCGFIVWKFTMSVTFCDKNDCQHHDHGTSGTENLDSLVLQLKVMLPHARRYIICSCKGNEHEFEAVLRTDINQKDQAVEWKAAFEATSKTTWRVATTFPHVQAKVLFKAIYRCHHKTNPRSSTADARRSSKNTNCQAELRIKVGRSVIARTDRSPGALRLSRSKDPHHWEYPTEIVIKHRHNHPIHASSALKHRDVAEETKAKIDHLLLDGYAPSAALEKFKFGLQLQDPDNYTTVIGDRALCPDLGWVYRRSHALGAEKYGGKDSPEALKNFVASLNFEFMSAPASNANSKLLFNSHAENTEQKVFMEDLSTRESEVQSWSSRTEEAQHFPLTETKQTSHQYVAMEVTRDQQNVVAICTPLMHRVHQSVEHSGETVFIDSTGNVGRTRSGYRVFLLMTHACDSGLPLGVLLTSNESSSTITAGLKLLCKIIGPDGFYGRGQRGPLQFMADDSKSEIAALRESFQDSAQFLCAFHLLQSFWRFLWDQKTQVLRQHCQHIFFLIKSILFASDKTELDELCAAAMGDTILSQYPHVRGHIAKSLLGKKDLWAVCCREGLLLRGNNSNFCDTAMRALRDQILQCTKAFNVEQLVDFICHDFEAYYVQRCADIANNQLSQVCQCRYLMDLEGITDESISQVGEASELQFDVRSMSDPSVVYRVDMTVELCTCKQGNTGGPCKHQAAVVKKFKLPSWNFIPQTDPVIRQIFHYLGTGTYCPSSWFEDLKKFVKSEEPESPVVHSDNVDESSEADFTRTHEQTETTKGEKSDILAIKKGLRDIVDDWIKKLDDDPESHSNAFENFLKNAGNLKSTLHLHNALCTFGKFSGLVLRSYERNVSAANELECSQQHFNIENNHCQAGNIGCPMLVASERPHEKAYLQETLSGSSLPKKPKIAPHNL